MKKILLSIFLLTIISTSAFSQRVVSYMWNGRYCRYVTDGEIGSTFASTKEVCESLCSYTYNEAGTAKISLCGTRWDNNVGGLVSSSNSDAIYDLLTGDFYHKNNSDAIYNPDTDTFANSDGVPYDPETDSFIPPTNGSGTGTGGTNDPVSCPSPPVCKTNEILFHCECVCKAGYEPDYNGQCISKCIVPTIYPKSSDWKVYINNYNSDNECFIKASTFSGEYKYRMIDNSVGFDICRFAICEVKEIKNDQCIDRSDLITPIGFVYHGKVNTTLKCQSYVNGVDYVDSKVTRIFPNCDTNYQKYCFLKPSVNNSDSGIPLPDKNDTIADIPNISDTPPTQTTPNKADNIANNQELKKQTQALLNINKNLTNNKNIDLSILEGTATDISNKLTSLQNINSNGFISVVEAINNSSGGDKNSSLDYTDLLTEENNYTKMIANDIAEMKSYFDDNSSSQLPDEGSISSLLTNLESDMNGLKSKFTDTKSLIDNGFTVTIPTGVNPAFSTSALGGTINLDLCSSFAPLKPIFSFVFVLIFMYLAIKIFILGIRI